MLLGRPSLSLPHPALPRLRPYLQVLFKHVRHNPALQSLRPVLIHLNSHPEKFERMRAAEARYVRGDLHALDPFPDGSM